MNVLFRKKQLSAPGSVSWDLNQVGMIEATPNSKDVHAEDAAIEAGAQDFESADAVVSMPIDKLPVVIILNIMVGGAALCQAAGIPIADVH